MRRRPTPPAAGALVALTLALTLSACGGDAEAEGEKSGNTPSARSAATDGSPKSSADAERDGADEATTSPDKVDAAVPPVDAGEEVPKEDLRAMLLQAVAVDGSARMKGTQIADGTTSLTTGIYSRSGGEVALDITTSIEGEEGLEALETHTVLVDGALYSRTSGISGESYLKTPVGGDGTLMDFSYLDPIAALEQHGDAISQVVYVGTETHDGKKLTRYDVTVDQEKGGDEGAEVSAFTYSVFFNGKGRIARAAMTVGEDAATVTNYSDWSGKHEVVAPPADDVMELPGA